MINNVGWLEIIHTSYGKKKGFSQLMFRLTNQDVDLQNRSITVYYIRGTLLIYEK